MYPDAGRSMTGRGPRWAAFAAGLALLLPLAGCQRVPEADASFVAKWTETHYALARAERLSPPVASRVTAYAAIALYEGWVVGSDSLQTLAGQLEGLASLPTPPEGHRLDRALVGLEAQTVVLRGLYAGGFPSTDVAITVLYDSLVAARMAAGVDEATKTRSIQFGATLGAAILQWAEADGFATRELAFTAGTTPGAWVPTASDLQYRSQNLSGQTDVVFPDNPTGRADAGALGSERSLAVNRPKTPASVNTPTINPTVAMEPGWGSLRPFGLSSIDACPAPAPVPFSSEPGSAFYREAEAIYRLTTALTPEQNRIAYFWADNPGETGTPAGHWLSVLAGLAHQWNLSPERTVEAYALTAMAVADGFIASFRAKYATDLIRPESYIRRYIDSTWRPLLVTPPFPTFTSAHSTQSAAAAEVLTALFGDNRPYDDATHVLLGHPVKHLPSFRAAADEAGRSRWYGGIHYPMDHVQGAVQGKCLAAELLSRIKTRRS